MTRLSTGIVLVCLLVWLQQGQTAVDELQARIDAATAANVILPREESQELIDSLLLELDGATPDQRAEIIFLQARNLALAGDYAEGMALLEPYFAQDLSPTVKLKVLRLAANIALQRDRFEEAYRFLLQGLELLPDVSAVGPKTNLLALVAYFYSAAGEGRKAIEYGKRGLQLAQSSVDLRAQCVAHHDLSVAQERAGAIEAALATRQQAVTLCSAANDPVHSGASQVALGHLSYQVSGDAGAIEHIRSGIARLEASGYRDGVLNGRMTLAQVLLEEGAIDEASALLEPLAEAFEQTPHWSSLSNTHGLLARVAEAKGDLAGALAHQRAAEEAEERWLDRERSMRLAYLQVELDTRQKEQQIQLLRERNHALELREETQRQRRILAFGTIAAMSVIGLLLFLLLMRTRSDRRDLLWLSQHDGLTGLRNRASFFRRASEAYAASRKLQQPFTLIIADIDYFKKINDQHGHIAGDAVLAHVGKRLRSVFDTSGIVGRLGGEEFAMALPGVGRKRAREMIDEFNQRLCPVLHNDTSLALTVSYGLIESRDDTPMELLRHRADAALYEAKRRGRNCTVDAAEIAADRAAQRNRRVSDLQ